MKEISQNARILAIIKSLQAIDNNIPLSYCQVLFHVAENPGCALVDIQERTGIVLSTLSRVVHAMADNRQKEAQAFGLLRIEADLNNHRRLSIYLTNKGEKTVKATLRVLAKAE